MTYASGRSWASKLGCAGTLRAASEMGSRHYRAYGLSIETDFGFSVPLRSDEEREPDLRFVAGEDLVGVDWGPPAYASELVNDNGQSLVELWRDGDRELLSFTGRTSFLLNGDTVCYSREHSPALVESLFLSSVLAYLLERRGVLALHGSAVNVEGAGVCFLAQAGTGKSSLAAAFVKVGHPLLTDDVVAVHRSAGGFMIHSAFPEIKINPDVGSFLLGSRFESLERVNAVEEKRGWRVDQAGSGQASVVALRRVFVLSRNDELRSVARRSHLTRLEASVELLRAGFTPNLAEAAGLAPDRLRRISALTEEVPVESLVLRSGIADLPQVVEGLLRDLREA